METTPFHAGEHHVQERLGVREEIEPWARRVVRSYLPEGHRSFYAQLPFVVLAARDADERPWVTLLADEPGFVSSPEPQRLEIGARPAPGDALAGALREGHDVGLLGIELDTRRRNRVNGRVGAEDAGVLALSVEQSFGNCPQYITARRWQRAPRAEGPPRARRTQALTEAQQAFLQEADTFFIASGFRGDGDHESYGMDASHRGGAPGFVRVASAREIVFPDYAGNNHFNTLGNLVLDPRVGLTFVDFETGDLLQLSGCARIDWDSPEVATVAGARRLVHIEIEAVVSLAGALPIRWASAGASVRELRVVGKRRESADVVSFLLEARDGGALPDFGAGQHLPIELEIDGHDTAVLRTYSLSSGPDEPVYRISVKRDPLGLASRHLHDRVEVGAFLAAGAPQGSFHLAPPSERPVVLLSAGVGLTPMVSMLHTLAGDDTDRPVWFVHGARDGEHHPLRPEVARLAASDPKIRHHFAYSRPNAQDVAGRDYHSIGRIDAALLEKLIPGLEADFYLCGPLRFMGSLESDLVARGVPAERIHSESFGPSA